jgi:uncharacterized membrane protein HdeD (DUF308 family)
MAETRYGDRLWGGLALRGIVAILFGILALSKTEITVVSLVLLFGAYAFIDGIFALVASVHVAEMHGRWGSMVLVGLCGIAVGILTFLMPAVTLLGLVYYIACWAIVTGILEISAAIRLRHVIHDEWMLGVVGVLSVAFGLLTAIRPAAGLAGVIYSIGLFAIILGCLQIGLSVRVHGIQSRLASV